MNIHRLFLAATTAAALCCAHSGAVAAPKKGSNADHQKTGVSSDSATDVSAVATATALARYGDARKDPLALITAARLLKQAGPSPTEFQRVAGKPGEAKQAQDRWAVDAILARAKALAGGDATLIALADDVAKTGKRGATGGGKGVRTVVRSRGTDRFRVVFNGGEPARVLVSGDGDSDLDLYVVDENGNVVCKDDDATDDMVCGWTPRWTGTFIIQVVNRGVANEYRMMTN